MNGGWAVRRAVAAVLRGRGQPVRVPRDGTPLTREEICEFMLVLRGYADRRGTARVARRERVMETRARWRNERRAS